MEALLIVMALIFSPFNPENDYSELDRPEIRETLALVAIDLQLLDKEEFAYICDPNPGDYYRAFFDGDEWITIQDKNFTQLIGMFQRANAKKFPKIEEIDLFYHEHSYLMNAIACNRACDKTVREGLAFGFIPPWNAELAEMILDEIDAHSEVYHYLIEASSISSPILQRRHALSQLRERIGNEAYYSGRMPPPIPYWRFPRTR